jgi:hypothetical protein
LKLHFEKAKRRRRRGKINGKGDGLEVYQFDNIVFPPFFLFTLLLLAFAYQGKDIVFRFIIE